MFVDGPINTEREAPEPPEGGKYGERRDTEDNPFCAFCQAFGREDEVVEKVSQHEDGKVQRRQL